MSRYDNPNEDDSFLSRKIETKKEIEQIYKKYYQKSEKFQTLIDQDKKEYFNFVINHKDEDDQEDIKNNEYEIFQSQCFSSCKSQEKQIRFFIDYLKENYGVINGRILSQYMNKLIKSDEIENDDAQSEREYKKILLYNFNKETINLNNQKEYFLFYNFILYLFE